MSGVKEYVLQRHEGLWVPLEAERGEMWVETSMTGLWTGRCRGRDFLGGFGTEKPRTIQKVARWLPECEVHPKQSFEPEDPTEVESSFEMDHSEGERPGSHHVDDGNRSSSWMLCSGINSIKLRTTSRTTWSREQNRESWRWLLLLFNFGDDFRPITVIVDHCWHRTFCRCSTSWA